MRQPRQPHALAGRSIGKGMCDICGAAVSIKVNRNGIAYYHCTAPRDGPIYGLRCSRSVKWGRIDSDEIIRRSAAAAATEQEETTDGEDRHERAEPEPERPAPRKQPVRPDDGGARRARTKSDAEAEPEFERPGFRPWWDVAGR